MKAGRILLLVLALFAMTGVVTTTFAQGSASPIPTNVNVATGTCLTSLTYCSSICSAEEPLFKAKPQPKVIVAAEKPVIQTVVKTEAVAFEPTPEVTVEPTPQPLNLDTEKIFSLVNEYRAKLALPGFEKNEEVCQLAQTRSTEIVAEIQNGTLHSGLYNRPLAYWIWENAKYGSDEAGTVAWWLSSPVHHQSIVGDYKYSCVACTGSYCSELFTSFVPK